MKVNGMPVLVICERCRNEIEANVTTSNGCIIVSASPCETCQEWAASNAVRWVGELVDELKAAITNRKFATMKG